MLQTGIEPATFGYHPDALTTELLSRLHLAEHETGNRPAPVGITTSPNPWPKRRSGSINETSFSCKPVCENFLPTSVGCSAATTAQGAAQDPPSSLRAKRSNPFRRLRRNGLLRRFAPLRKRFAFVAGNDAATVVVGWAKNRRVGKAERAHHLEARSTMDGGYVADAPLPTLRNYEVG